MLVPFPPDCPPDDAAPKPGTYYRLAPKGMEVEQPTTDRVWLRPYETPRSALQGRADLADAHGLSVFADLEDLRSAAKFTPWLRGKSVAAVNITASDGYLRTSPAAEGNSHNDWWTDPYDLIPDAVIIEILREAA